MGCPPVEVGEWRPGHEIDIRPAPDTPKSCLPEWLLQVHSV